MYVPSQDGRTCTGFVLNQSLQITKRESHEEPESSVGVVLYCDTAYCRLFLIPEDEQQ
jgi:hypothetical protein